MWELWWAQPFLLNRKEMGFGVTLVRIPWTVTGRCLFKSADGGATVYLVANVRMCVSTSMLSGNPAEVNNHPTSVIMRELTIVNLCSELTPADIYISCSGGEGLPFIEP